MARNKAAEHKEDHKEDLLLEEWGVSKKTMEDELVQLESEQEAAAKAELRAANTRKAHGERFQREAAERVEAERVLASRDGAVNVLAPRAMQPY